MPRSEKSNAIIKDERRCQILVTALKMFTRYGFSGTKMSDIANEAGISYGLVYHYFESKDDIYTELIKSAIRHSNDAFEKLENSKEEPIQKIKKIVDFTFNAMDNHEVTGYFFILMTQASISELNPPEATKLIAESQKPFDVICKVIRLGQQKGQIRQFPADDLAMVFFATLEGMAYYKVCGLAKKMPQSDVIIKLFLA